MEKNDDDDDDDDRECSKSTDLHRYFANVSYIPVDFDSFRLSKEIRFVFFFEVVNFSGQRREISIP